MTNAVVAALRAHARHAPRTVALVGDDAVLDYATLAARVDVLASWLRTRGVRRAGLSGDNSTAWIVADLAAWSAGVALVPLPTYFSAAQLRHATEAAGLRDVLVCAGSDGCGATDARPSPAPGVGLARFDTARADAPPLPPDVCKITFTSGTTGTPKGVLLTTAMLEAVARALATRLGGAAAPDRHFVLLPLATLLENVAGVYAPLLLGRSVVVHDGPRVGLTGSSQLDVARLLHALHADRPGSLIVLPQILHALVAAAERGTPPPDSLRFVAVGGAFTPAALLQRAEALGLPVHEGYGLSECASVVALNAPGARRAGSVGRVLDHVRVRIAGGAIQVAGNVFPGYLGEPVREREWLDTGDLGRFDEDGYLYVTGRRKHLIITGYGRNIAPEWVEAELSLCASIAQVAVIGDAQPFCAAIVVPARGADAAAIARDLSAANRDLPDYARIRRFIVAAPFSAANGCLTANGRLRRDAIAARHADAIAALYSQPPHETTPGPAHDVV